MTASNSALSNPGEPSAYIGRFAPSPTGPLHQGSLLAAVASYLDARAHNGTWLVRIEDVDSLRTVKGASEQILRALEAHGLLWDGEVRQQTDCTQHYLKALDKLASNNHIFYCNCSRKLLKEHGKPYPGFCRNCRNARYTEASRQQPASHAIRFDVGTVEDTKTTFTDRILGNMMFDLNQLGDFIIRRRDSLIAYQLAVVVDDKEQQISHIVRGADLLTSTPWQIVLQQALGYPAPAYAHLPLIVHLQDQSKLSKQTGAPALDNRQARQNLLRALQQLDQILPPDCLDADISEILAFAADNWDITRISHKNINAEQ